MSQDRPTVDPPPTGPAGALAPAAATDVIKRSDTGGELAAKPVPANLQVGGGASAALWLSLLLGFVTVGGLAAASAWVTCIELSARLAALWRATSPGVQGGFYSGFYVAAAVTLLGLGWSVVGALTDDGKGLWRPATKVVLVWLAWWLLAGVGLAVARRKLGLDLATIEASGFLVAVQAAVVAAPLYALWQALRVTRWVWRKGRASGFVAGMAVAGSLAGSGAVGAFAASAAAPSSEATATSGAVAIAALEQEFDEPGNRSLPIIAKSWLDRIALADPRPARVAQEALSPKDERLRSCFEELAAGGTKSAIRTAIGSLRGRSLDSADAQDLAYETALRVCLRYAENSIAELRPYYFGALSKLRISFNRKPFRRWCLGQDMDTIARPDTDLALTDSRVDLERVFCILSPAERSAVQGRFDGLDDDEIATAAGSTSEAVRQACSRGARRLSEALKDKEK